MIELHFYTSIFNFSLPSQFLLSVIDSVKFISKDKEDTAQAESEVDDWKWISMILDRFLLYTYGSTMIIGTVWMFYSVYQEEYPVARQGFGQNCEPLVYGECDTSGSGSKIDWSIKK